MSYAFKILLRVASAKFTKETYRLVLRGIIGRGGWSCAFIIIIGERLFCRTKFHGLTGCATEQRENVLSERRGEKRGSARGWKGIKGAVKRMEWKSEDQKVR